MVSALGNGIHLALSHPDGKATTPRTLQGDDPLQLIERDDLADAHDHVHNHTVLGRHGFGHVRVRRLLLGRLPQIDGQACLNLNIDPVSGPQILESIDVFADRERAVGIPIRIKLRI